MLQTSDKRTIKKGDIYYIHENPKNKPTGSEMWANRPAIIISNNINNKHSRVVQLVYLSSVKKSLHLKTHILVQGKADKSSYLKSPSIALCEQIHAVDKSRIGNYIGKITKEELEQIHHAISTNLNLEVEL